MKQKIISIIAFLIALTPSYASGEELTVGPCWVIEGDFMRPFYNTYPSMLNRQVKILNWMDNPIVSDIGLLCYEGGTLSVRLSISEDYKLYIINRAKKYDIVFKPSIAVENTLWFSGTPEQIGVVLALVNELDPLSDHLLGILTDVLYVCDIPAESP